jgi:hypothetical protein
VVRSLRERSGIILRGQEPHPPAPVMSGSGRTDALTADRHFEKAVFRPLLV